MQNVILIIFVVIAFLSGSIPTALLLGRMKGIDIRQHGSGNIGATNVTRTMGRRWGLICLLGDMLKGWLPVMAIQFIYNLFETANLTEHGWMWLAGVAAIAGHMFSPFVGFRGGKGVATSIGVLLAIAPWPLLICAIVSIVVIWLTGYVSLASMVGAAMLPAMVIVINLVRSIPVPWTSVWITLALALIIAWKHRANIARLRAGTEPRITDRQHAPEEPS